MGKRGKGGEIHHRSGRYVTLTAPKPVSVMTMVGGAERIIEAHDRAVRTTLGRIEKNAVRTRMQDQATGAMVRADGQKLAASAFRHDTSWHSRSPQRYKSENSRESRRPRREPDNSGRQS